MKLFRIILIFFMVCILHTAKSQDFSGGLIGGATTSQVHGDGVGGFYKFGLSLGGFVERDFHDFFSTQIELRFTQKGAADNTGNFKINLGYVEVPFLIKYTYNDLLSLTAGLGFGVPVYASYYDFGITVKTPDFDPIDVQYYVGGSVRISELIVLDLRSAYTIIPINRKFINWTLYASLHYYLRN